jgi:hypothetical protein
MTGKSQTVLWWPGRRCKDDRKLNINTGPFTLNFKRQAMRRHCWVNVLYEWKCKYFAGGSQNESVKNLSLIYLSWFSKTQKVKLDTPVSLLVSCVYKKGWKGVCRSKTIILIDTVHQLITSHDPVILWSKVSISWWLIRSSPWWFSPHRTVHYLPGWDLAEWLERLTVNAKVATIEIDTLE